MSGEATTVYDPLQKLAVIIGATRSGSTSLVESLSQHPEICACRVEEAGFFSNDDRWERGVASYREMWDWNPEQHKVALEKTTNYSKVTIFPMAASRMAEVAPNAKIMYIMRHPFERMESQYTLGRATGWRESKRSLRQGVHQDLIECSRYAKQLDAYFRLFPRENMLLLRFEELRDSPAVLLDRVCGFLAIDRREFCSHHERIGLEAKRYQLGGDRRRSARKIVWPELESGAKSAEAKEAQCPSAAAQ